MSFGNSNEIRYARQVTLRIKPDQRSSFLAKMRGDIFPELKKQPGIRRMYLLRAWFTSKNQDEFVSLTLWNTKADADAYGASEVFRNNIEAIKESLESDISLTEFEVDLHDVNAGDLPVPKTAARKVSARRKRKGMKQRSKSKKRGRRSR